MGSRNTEEPAPKASNHKPAWELVIKYVEDNFEDADDLIRDMKERDKIGREKYGVPLQAGNGRNHLVDAAQELLDHAVYLRAFLDERGIDPDGLQQPTFKRELTKQEELAVGLFRDTIENLCDLWEVI